MKLTKPQRRALRRLHTGPGFVSMAWLGTRVCISLAAKGLALTTTTREIAPTAYGRWVARTLAETGRLFDA